MKVVNYNDYFRKQIKTFALELKKKENYKQKNYVNLFSRLYYNIKTESPFYNYLLGLVFETAYLVTSLSFIYYPDDENLKNSMTYLKSFSDIDDLRNRLTINSFINFLDDVVFFYESDIYNKRNAVENALKDKENLKNMFPGFLNDVIFYLNRYDATFVIKEYWERKKQNEEDAFNITVKLGVEDLINLKSKDFDAYKYVILEMIESFYMYKVYLLFNNLLDDEFDIDIISMIEEDLHSTIYFSANNITLLRKIVSGYLEYNVLPSKEINEIHDYNNKKNRERFIKVMKKSYELKKGKK